MKFFISSHGIEISKNPFNDEIEFSQGIDSVESMPGVLKSVKVRTQQRLANIGFGNGTKLPYVH
jgi:hypothetical protein